MEIANIFPKIIDIQLNSAEVESNDNTTSRDSHGLRKLILDGLNQPAGQQKRVPGLIMWDKRGLELFQELDNVKEYYILEDEKEILNVYGHQIAALIPNESIIIELGAGSLLKTSILLDALEKTRENIQYYGLDLVKDELERTLLNLKKYKNIETAGLLGTYEDGREFLKQLPPNRRKILLWIGSSIGNLTRSDAADFLASYNPYLNDGDCWIIGIDRRNDPNEIFLAYDDPAGIQANFCLNGLQNVNNILNQQDFFDLSKFEYYIRYNREGGRVESFYKSIAQQKLLYKDVKGETDTEIHLEKDELINFTFAHKYAPEESRTLFKNAKLHYVTKWTSASCRYDLHMVQK